MLVHNTDVRTECTGQCDLLGLSSSRTSNHIVVPTDLLKGRAEDLKPNPYLRKSPSLESLSRPPSLAFGGSRLLGTSPGGWKPQSKLRYPSESVPLTFAAPHQLFWQFVRLRPEVSSFCPFTLLLLGPPSPEVAAHSWWHRHPLFGLCCLTSICI